ncbi:hypothetical protein [Sandaracinus amylolyticus]|uniref:Uncharacterized protein n=1 Tax=Sandaracinus amylolyticus TaxID=927083 RepID=A0A0F6YKX8_9BACT|nr:hypothetical protein [Sandaracinus amylolyticus]AKF08903.1 hypothetical protein DB32_006052 [Sandaracinus amylolyticus]
MTYEDALRHLRRILTHSPQIDRDALEVVALGPPRAPVAREEVVVSSRDPRSEDADAVPTEAIRALRESATAMEAASSAPAAASRAVSHATTAVARIEVQRERVRRSSQTIPRACCPPGCDCDGRLCRDGTNPCEVHR